LATAKSTSFCLRARGAVSVTVASPASPDCSDHDLSCCLPAITAKQRATSVAT
jgi:hypothetical protein